MKDVWRAEVFTVGVRQDRLGLFVLKVACPIPNSYSDDAVWDVVLALWAVQLGLRKRVGTIGARF